jgi:hypothetical protein
LFLPGYCDGMPHEPIATSALSKLLRTTFLSASTRFEGSDRQSRWFLESADLLI